MSNPSHSCFGQTSVSLTISWRYFRAGRFQAGPGVTPRGSDSVDLMGPGNLHIPKCQGDSNDPGFQTILIGETPSSKSPLPSLSLVRLSFLSIPGCKLVMIKLYISSYPSLKHLLGISSVPCLTVF